MSTSPRYLGGSLAAALLAPTLLGCGGGPPVSTTTAIYVVPASLDELSQETFFDHPWPSDLRLENGSPRLTGYYNPRGFPIIDDYVNSVKGVLDGFSPAASGFLRFTGAIDETTLPATPKDGLDPASSVQLLDIDPASPEHGKRKLVSLKWRAEEGVYYRPNTLAFMPAVGFPLRPHTRYALVVTDALQAKTGGSIAQEPKLGQVVGATDFDSATRVASAATAPAIKEVEAAGIDRSKIVHLAVFTTSDPTKELIAFRDALVKNVAAPTVDPATWTPGAVTTDLDEYTGKYGPSPNFQSGTVPYALEADGGGFVFNNGAPVVQSTFDARFSLSVPNGTKCPMPAAGYPIVLYAHGTGGDYQSYLSDGTARLLTQHCLAVMGVDQIFHGTRPGAPADGSESKEGLLFYNFQNPVAARTNGRQSALDEVQRARLFTASHLSIPAAVTSAKKEVHFDATKLMFFGHSQGGLNGPLFTAIDPTARGAVFSGSGAMIAIALLEKTKPDPSPAALVRTILLGLNTDEGSELDIFHPGISLIQTIIDVEDPLHYGRLQATEPRAGSASKSVYMTEGINMDGTGDSYAPPHGIEAHALSIGLPPQLPMQHDIAELAWGGVQPITVPAEGLAGNLGGGASGVLAQWAVPKNHDGHFVIFDVKAARNQSGKFLENLAADPKGLVPAP
jgi:enamine deaminase RidA (YjgF/YER057c/UK114 family)